MKPSIRSKLEKLSDRLEELNASLASEAVLDDLERYRRFSQEQAEIAPIVSLFNQYRGVETALEEAKALQRDPEFAGLAEDEIKTSLQKQDNLLQQLQTALLPKDPNDERNVILEIRAGTGGTESTLFAADLFRMYSRYAERLGWKIEVLSSSESDLGGFKEIIAEIRGQRVYSHLKFESGGHRVQRIPVTETQGRIHTSACTVAVMPEADAIAEIAINPAELRIDTFRASGAGGQHINKTDSAVRITHLPTGLVVECQDDRSQHRNKARALAVLAARLKDQTLRSQQAKEAATRKLLVGSGDRTERIRTYNFPQGRLTDHRINLTLYTLDSIMDGNLTDVIQALMNENHAELLAALGED